MVEMDPDEFRRLGHRAVDLLADDLRGLATAPARRPTTEALRRRIMDQPLPEEPVAADEILAAFEELVLPHPMGNDSPRFFSWVNSPPIAVRPLADLLAAALNPSVAAAITALPTSSAASSTGS